VSHVRRGIPSSSGTDVKQSEPPGPDAETEPGEMRREGDPGRGGGGGHERRDPDEQEESAATPDGEPRERALGGAVPDEDVPQKGEYRAAGTENGGTPERGGDGDLDASGDRTGTDEERVEADRRCHVRHEGPTTSRASALTRRWPTPPCA